MEQKSKTQSVLLSCNIRVPKNHCTIPSYAVKTTGLTGENGAGAQHSSVTHQKERNLVKMAAQLYVC